MDYMVHSLQWSVPPGRWSSWADLTQIDLTWVNLYLVSERGPEMQPDWWHFDKQYSAEFWVVSWVCIVVQFPDQFNPASWPFTVSQGRVFIMIKFFKLYLRACAKSPALWNRKTCMGEGIYQALPAKQRPSNGLNLWQISVTSESSYKSLYVTLC